MKFNLIYITIFALLSCAIFGQKFQSGSKSKSVSSENDSDVEDKDLTMKIFVNMGLKDKSTITRSEFEEFTFRLVTKDRPAGDNKAFFQAISKKMAQDIPHTIKTVDILNYLNEKKILNTIEEVVREMFGPEYVDQIKGAFGDLYNDTNKEYIQNQVEEEIEELEEEVKENTVNEEVKENDVQEEVKENTINEEVIEKTVDEEKEVSTPEL